MILLLILGAIYVVGESCWPGAFEALMGLLLCSLAACAEPAAASATQPQQLLPFPKQMSRDTVPARSCILRHTRVVVQNAIRRVLCRS